MSRVLTTIVRSPPPRSAYSGAWLNNCIGQANLPWFKACLISYTVTLVVSSLALAAVPVLYGLTLVTDVAFLGGSVCLWGLHPVLLAVVPLAAVLLTPFVGLALFMIWKLIMLHRDLTRLHLTTYEFIKRERWKYHTFIPDAEPLMCVESCPCLPERPMRFMTDARFRMGLLLRPKKRAAHREAKAASRRLVHTALSEAIPRSGKGTGRVAQTVALEAPQIEEEPWAVGDGHA